MRRARGRRFAVPRRAALVSAVVVVIASTVLWPGPGGGAASAGAKVVASPLILPQAEIQQVLDRFVAAQGAPGGVLALQVRGGPVTTFVTGTSDPATQAPMTAADEFYLVSITKTFVGTLALELLEQGSLSLDAPIDRYLKSWPHGDQITVRELLDHSSGIGQLTLGGSDKYSQIYSAVLLADLGHTFTPDEVLGIVRDRPLASAPGTKVSYSNVNTILLGEIIAKVTGKTLGTELDARLLEPLQLTSTAYAAERAPPTTPAAGLYEFNGAPPLVNTDTFSKTGIVTSLGAAGGMVSSAPDLVKWASDLYRDHKVLKPATASEAFRIGPDGAGLGVVGFGADGFCLFAATGCPKGETFTGLGGSGSIPGTSARVVYDRTTDAVIVLLVTRDGVAADAPVLAVRKLLARAERN